MVAVEWWRHARLAALCAGDMLRLADSTGREGGQTRTASTLFGLRSIRAPSAKRPEAPFAQLPPGDLHPHVQIFRWRCRGGRFQEFCTAAICRREVHKK
jgi:hypothetical protein